MSRTERLLAILQALRGRRHAMTARVLADQFGVSERTIYRDMAVLQGQGALIDAAAGFGFVLRDGYFLPPLAFEPEEAAAVLLGLRFAEQRGDPHLASAAATARGKLEAVCSQVLADARLASPLLVAPVKSAATLHIVRQALSAHRKLRIGYVDGDGRESCRIVWPVAVGFFDGCELAAAWCEMRAAFRHFRLDRMRSAELLQEPPGRSLRRLLADYRLVEPCISH